MERSATTIVPLWLLATLVAAGALCGWAALQVSGSVVAMGVAAAISWPGMALARRVRAAAGGGPRFAELPSAAWDADASLARRVGAQLASLFVYMAAFAVLAALLAQLPADRDAIGAMAASELNALIAALPVWWEVDARLGIRGSRQRAEDEQRLRALAVQARGASTLSVATLPLARLRLLLIAAGLLAGGCVAGTAAMFDPGSGPVERVIVGAAAAGCAVIAIVLVRIALRSPYFLRVSPEGVDPLGRGVVPWPAIVGFDIHAAQLQRWLALALDAPAQDAGWWRPGHRWLGRRFDNEALSLPLLFCAAHDEQLLAALNAYEDRPVTVHLQ